MSPIETFQQQLGSVFHLITLTESVSPQHKNQEFSPFLQRDNLLLIFITMPSYKYIWVIVG